MGAMPTSEEKTAFSKRLKLALRRSPEAVRGATELALRFNLRHLGSAVSAQTAHKWLTGRAIPTKEKLATLAAWLQVSEHWLHYGPPSEGTLSVREDPAEYEAPRPGKSSTAAKNAGKPAPDALLLAQKIHALPPHRRYLVEELVAQLLEAGE
jgi:transcriptional regulator with XRE-family HTH domain